MLKDHRIETGRLTLLPLCQYDLDWFVAFNGLPEIRKHLWDDNVLSHSDAENILKQNKAHFDDDDYGLWKALLRNDVVGYYGLWHFFGEPRPQLVYATAPGFSGCGFAVEASKAIADYAFSRLGFDYLDAATDAANEASQFVARKIGMTFHSERMEDGKPTIFFRLTAARLEARENPVR